MSAPREFDIVIYGATGFVGALTAEYLAGHAPAGTRIALAGRNETKLAKVRAALPATAAEWPLIVADSDSPASLDAMVARTQVVATTVGPFLKYGEALVVACASAGTDYADLTGEVPFVRFAIDKCDDAARASKARIVPACGFDSIPSDLGVLLLHEQATADGAGTLGDTTMVMKLRGAPSGGTIDTMRVIADLAKEKETRRILVNPQALSSGPGDMPRANWKSEPSDMPVMAASSVDPSLRGSLGPFVMASYNTRIVRRSNYLLDGAYGPDFRYGETMATGKNPVTSRVVAGGVAAGLGVFFGAMSLKPTRFVLDRFLPKPGEGPNEKARDRGWFTATTFTRTLTGKRYRATVAAKGDPGYKATAVMLGESALCLALDREALPDRFGVLTPATAMGDALIGRLRTAGMTLKAEELS